MTYDEVRHKLDNIGYYKPFTVVFTKTNGEQRKITGYMEQPTSEPRQAVSPSRTYLKAVPIVTEEGYKSFRLDSVMSIIT